MSGNGMRESAAAKPFALFPAVCTMEDMGLIVAEQTGINLFSEYSLHEQLKERIAAPGDRIEVSVEGKVVDLVRADGELVEVQTGHLGQLEPKVLGLAAKGYRVRVVYPVPAELELRRLNPRTNELVSTRRSPKRGDEYSLFDELVHAPGLIAADNVAVEVLVVKCVETRTRDGSGSWRRKGDRTLDIELVGICSSRSFCSREEWLTVIPAGLGEPWDSNNLGGALGIGPARARKILYCFSRAGLVAEAGKDGRLKRYARARSRPS